jgi:hypothetical protein
MGAALDMPHHAKSKAIGDWSAAGYDRKHLYATPTATWHSLDYLMDFSGGDRVRSPLLFCSALERDSKATVGLASETCGLAIAHNTGRNLADIRFGEFRSSSWTLL